jgi:hypothetical protein
MKTYLLYNLGTPMERWVMDLAERLKRERVEVELVDADSPRGIQLSENYDVMGRPAVMIVKDDGAPVQVWQGEDGLPLVNDIVYLARG